MASTVDLIHNGHTVVTRADLYYGGSLVQKDLPVLSGNISVDSTRATRRTCQLTIIDKTGTLIPKTSSDRLAPYGSELVIKRGLLVGGADFLIPQGRFRIATTDVQDEGSGISIAVSGYDQSRALSLNRFEKAYRIASNTRIVDAITDIIALQGAASGRSVALSIQTNATDQVGSVRILDAETDPWATVQSMATDIGCEIYFDVDGGCVLRPVPNPKHSQTHSTFEYGELSMFTKASNSLTDDPGYNGVIVTGEPPGIVPVTAEVWDTNQDSPTWYQGPYGKRPMFYRSQYIYNTSQAAATAQAMFTKNVGITEQAKFSGIPDPTLDAGHSIGVVYRDLGLQDFYIVESIEMPLGVEDAMTVVCKRSRFA